MSDRAKRSGSKSSLSKRLGSRNYRASVQRRTLRVRRRYNEGLAVVFDKLANIMKDLNDFYRARAYRNAYEEIMKFGDTDIYTVSQFNNIKGIGLSIRNKIEEFIKTGRVIELERLEKSAEENVFKSQLIVDLSNVYGIGNKKALDLINDGVKSVNDLKIPKYYNTLTAAQKKGLEYYEDLMKRIPRSEIDEYNIIMGKVFNHLQDYGFPYAKYSIAGSYRREKPESGDIDVILSHENKNFFDEFTKALIEQGLIIEVLSHGSKKMLAIAKLDGNSPARRIDFLFTSPEEYPFAILYFTGSKEFNTAMREYIQTLGMTMNEHAIYEIDEAKEKYPIKETFETEEDIFAYLHLKYVEPKDRIDGNALVIV